VALTGFAGELGTSMGRHVVVNWSTSSPSGHAASGVGMGVGVPARAAIAGVPTAMASPLAASNRRARDERTIVDPLPWCVGRQTATLAADACDSAGFAEATSNWHDLLGGTPHRRRVHRAYPNAARGGIAAEGC
jgi:hypothetical protein